MKRTATLLIAVVLASVAVAEEAPTVPEALRGFRGMVEGTVAAIGKGEFILRIDRITRTWKQNKAENPQAAVGKRARCVIGEKGRLREQHLKTLATLKPSDRVSVEPFHLEPGDRHLTVMEALEKLAAEEPKDGDGGEGGVPAGIRGFQGMVSGTLVSKGETAFVLKVDKILRVWKRSKASNPQCIVGIDVKMHLTKRSRLYERHLRALRELKPGDRVVCEPFHFEGDSLAIVEELRKAE